MRRGLVALLALAAAAHGEGGITPPALGFIRDQAAAVRPVYGVAGSFILGEPIEANVLSAAFSGELGVVKTPEEVVLLDRKGLPLGRWPAEPGPAWFAFSPDGKQALALLAGSPTLLHWKTAWRAAAIHVSTDTGDVIAVAFSARGAAMVLQRDDGVWLVEVELETGAALDQTPLPGVSGPLFLRHDGTLIFGDSGDLVVRKPDGAELRLPAGFAVSGFEQIGENWLRVHAPGESWALRLRGEEAELYRLPEAAP